MNSSHFLLLYGVQNIRTEKDTEMSILGKNKKSETAEYKLQRYSLHIVFTSW